MLYLAFSFDIRKKYLNTLPKYLYILLYRLTDVVSEVRSLSGMNEILAASWLILGPLDRHGHFVQEFILIVLD